MANGIDVYSAYQTVHNWRSVRNAGYEFCYVKLSDGVSPRNEAGYIGGGKRAGIKMGGYHYAQFGNATTQANYFINRCERYGALDLAPALDLEAPFVANQTAINFAVEFCRQVKRRGHRPCLYANNSMMKTVRGPVLAAVPDTIIWVARYGANPSVGWSVWQHSQSGHVPGISASSVDLNTGAIPLNTIREDDLANVTDAQLAKLLEAADSVLFGIPKKRNAGPLALTDYDIQQRVKDLQSQVKKLTDALSNLNGGANSVQFGQTGVRTAGDLARTVYDIQQKVNAIDAKVNPPEAPPAEDGNGEQEAAA